jgi:spore germination protein YaaH
MGPRRASLTLPVVLAAAALLAGPAAIASAAPTATGAAEAAPYRVSAWTFGSRASLARAHGAGAVDEVQADWYAVRADGSLTSDSVDPAFVGLAHADGCRVLAVVTNWAGGDFSPSRAHAVLTSANARAKLVADLREACSTYGFDGVDLDIESVPARDRDLLSSFVEEAAEGLHADGRILAMAVHPKTSEPGDWSGAQAEDYARLGAALDEFQVMTYAYSGAWSRPGPIAPPGWMGRVLGFAVSQVDPAKVWMGLPFYGCDWWPGGATEITWAQAVRRRTAHHRRVTRTASGEARFIYRDWRGRHVVYFQDRTALAAKLRVLTRRDPGAAGVTIWVMGGEDPRFWPFLAGRLGRRGPPARAGASRATAPAARPR